MSKAYYIGIGGTGARVAEALVHLCAAGFGPSELFLFLVDPDEGNGNLSRTKTLIAKYAEIRSRIRDRALGVNVFRTNIVTPDPVVWSIFSDQSMTLERYIGHANMKLTDKPLASLAEVLFSRQELDTRLDEGFRGHPSIGAVVMARPDENRDPWKTFYDDLSTLTRPGDARVFMAGSIFGGTGAAGVPTFASRELLKHHKSASLDEGRASKVQLGGCLVLPYFAFPNTPPEEERDRLYVTTADFPLATRAALQYYYERALHFDDIYLLGDSLTDNVGQFAAGAGRQENRPHYIELVSALAALDFFARSEPGAKNRANHFTAARNGEEIHWEDLPVSRDPANLKQEQDRLRFSLTTASLFFYALSTYGSEALVEADIHKQFWWNENFRLKVKSDDELARFDPCASAQRDLIEKVADFGKLFLAWLGGIHETPEVKLLDMGKIVDPDKRPLRRSQARGLGSVVRGKEASFDNFIQDLDTVGGLRGSMASSTAADKFLNLFALGASRYARHRLDVQAPEAK